MEEKVLIKIWKEDNGDLRFQSDKNPEDVVDGMNKVLERIRRRLAVYEMHQEQIAAEARKTQNQSPIILPHLMMNGHKVP